MRTDTRRLLLALELFAIPAHAADDTPPWLKELTGITLPEYPAKVNSVVLLNEEHHTAAENGRLVSNTRTAIKVLTRQGRDVLFFDEYDTRSGKVRDFRAWMIAPTGKVKKYGKDEIVDVACVENDVYNECRKRAVSGSRDAEVGAIFAYESTIEYESFSSEIAFHFQDSSPVRMARLTVTMPVGWEIKSASFNGAPAEAAPTASAYTWQMENLPALEHERSSPSFLTLAPWVGVTFLPPGDKHPPVSWTGLSRVLAELNAGQAEPNDAITAKARNLVEGATTDLDKIRAIGRFTQQLNYVSIRGIEAREANGQLVLEGHFTSDRFVQRPQNGMMVFRAGLLRHGDYRFTEKTRKYPIVIGTDALHETVRIELPKDFKVDELPEAVRLRSDFGRFEATWVAKDGTLTFQRTLEIQSQTVPPPRYQELKKFLDAVSAAEDAPVVLLK